MNPEARPSEVHAPAVQFQATHWSVVLAAGDSQSPQAEQALAALCQTYWYPVYAFVRRQQYDHHKAQDLTQEFFTQLLTKKYLKKVNSELGRFRSFLLKCVQHFLSHEARKEAAIKRGGNYNFVSWDDLKAAERYAKEPAHLMSPDTLYERSWVLKTLEQALTALAREFAEAGKEAEFEVLQVFLSGAKDSSISYADAGRRLNVSESAARQKAHRLRVRFRELLRQIVAQTVDNPGEVDRELGYLLEVLSR
jgi:RNA polymerase sigma-70 factor (ECF subfamily)